MKTGLPTQSSRFTAALGTWFDKDHPALSGFVTDDFTDWQWYDLAEGGVYTFSVKGDPHDIEHAKDGERDNRSAVIDGLSLRKIARDTVRAAPQVAEDLQITVATGAKLKLDFDGSVRIDSVKLDAWHHLGVKEFVEKLPA